MTPPVMALPAAPKACTPKGPGGILFGKNSLTPELFSETLFLA
jgi:hypothetical protein